MIWEYSRQAPEGNRSTSSRSWSWPARADVRADRPRFVLVDTEGWFWIRTVGAPRDGDPRDGELAPVDSGRYHVRGRSVEIELVALDVLHHDARLVVAIGRQ